MKLKSTLITLTLSALLSASALTAHAADSTASRARRMISLRRQALS